MKFTINLVKTDKTRFSITYIVMVLVFGLVMPIPAWVYWVAFGFDLIENYMRAKKS